MFHTQLSYIYGLYGPMERHYIHQELGNALREWWVGQENKLNNDMSHAGKLQITRCDRRVQIEIKGANRLWIQVCKTHLIP